MSHHSSPYFYYKYRSIEKEAAVFLKNEERDNIRLVIDPCSTRTDTALDPVLHKDPECWPDTDNIDKNVSCMF